ISELRGRSRRKPPSPTHTECSPRSCSVRTATQNRCPLPHHGRPRSTKPCGSSQRIVVKLFSRDISLCELIGSYRSNILRHALPASPVVPSSCAFTFPSSLNYSRVIPNGSVECF